MKAVSLSRKLTTVFVIAEYLLMICPVLAISYLVNAEASGYIDPENGVIVVDAGHGGIDGGANRDGIPEKAINLNLALKLKTLLEHKGFKVILPRDQDVSLDNLNQASGSRHERDLIARVAIINASNAADISQYPC